VIKKEPHQWQKDHKKYHKQQKFSNFSKYPHIDQKRLDCKAFWFKHNNEHQNMARKYEHLFLLKMSKNEKRKGKSRHHLSNCLTDKPQHITHMRNFRARIT